jgi:hypothetical protein
VFKQLLGFSTLDNKMDEKVTMTISNHAADDENQKPIIHPTELGEEGAQRIELMQEVWGKHGKLYIFLSYEEDPLHPNSTNKMILGWRCAWLSSKSKYPLPTVRSPTDHLSELDGTTFATYYVYAISSFNKTASSSALALACNLTFSLMKPIWAKISDIFGRGEMYPAALVSFHSYPGQ